MGERKAMARRNVTVTQQRKRTTDFKKPHMKVRWRALVEQFDRLPESRRIAIAVSRFGITWRRRAGRIRGALAQRWWWDEDAPPASVHISQDHRTVYVLRGDVIQVRVRR